MEFLKRQGRTAGTKVMILFVDFIAEVTPVSANLLLGSRLIPGDAEKGKVKAVAIGSRGAKSLAFTRWSKKSSTKLV